MDYKSYRLYEQGAGPGLRIVGLITRAEGERMVRAKTAQAGQDRDGETLCFLRIDTRSANAVPTFVPARPVIARTTITNDELPAEISSAAFSIAEMNAIAGTKFRHGRSRTANLTDEQREARARRIYEGSMERNGYGVKVKPEDIVERAANKYAGFEELGPAFQDLVREAVCL